MYVYTPVRNNAGRATTLSPATLSPANHPPPYQLFREAATILTVCRVPTLTATYTFYHRPPTSPRLGPPISPSPFRERGITASTIHNARRHPLALNHPSTHPPGSQPPLRTRTPSSSRRAYLPLSLSVSTSVFLKRPIQSTQRVRPYLAVSTGTPVRSLKENAIIRRTSTNELIVGASRYRQYRGVLYSTSPGATRL